MKESPKGRCPDTHWETGGLWHLLLNGDLTASCELGSLTFCALVLVFLKALHGRDSFIVTLELLILP